MISINPNVSPFGITSCSKFLTNFLGSIPLVGAIVGMERIRAVALTTPKETNIKVLENSSSFQSSPAYATEHCFRAVFEILGVGSLIFITEIVCKLLGFLVRLIGYVLLAAICSSLAILFVIGAIVAVFLYGIVKLVAKAIPLYEQPEKSVTKEEILAVFHSLAFRISELVWASADKLITATTDASHTSNENTHSQKDPFQKENVRNETIV
ncbi:hypothetical protein [Chlamydia sp. 17-3921]|uniref:hypothetical protein n=1 Tax=Chlamydia sp. 17-3921 TaxID=2675798 RepID=UPI0019182611|nr:hypothetical protein [Chlamydia sp. 17-3921]